MKNLESIIKESDGIMVARGKVLIVWNVQHEVGRAAAEESLALLPNLPLDYVKLDRSLTANLATNPGRQNWMRELVHRIRSTGPRIIAGYVEDAQSLGLLWQAEIELVQGNFVQQPDEWLHHGSMI